MEVDRTILSFRNHMILDYNKSNLKESFAKMEFYNIKKERSPLLVMRYLVMNRLAKKENIARH